MEVVAELRCYEGGGVLTLCVNECLLSVWIGASCLDYQGAPQHPLRRTQGHVT